MRDDRISCARVRWRIRANKTKKTCVSRCNSSRPLVSWSCADGSLTHTISAIIKELRNASDIWFWLAFHTVISYTLGWLLLKGLSKKISPVFSSMWCSNSVARYIIIRHCNNQILPFIVDSSSKNWQPFLTVFAGRIGLWGNYLTSHYLREINGVTG